MAKVTVEQVQTKLKELGYYEGDIDGLGGPLTAAAVVEFQKNNKIEPQTGKLDPATLEAMFPHKVEPPRTIQATFTDWIINGVTSKVNQVAAAAAGALALWLTTQFGLDVSPDMKAWIASGISFAALALIGLLRTRFDSPHVADKTPGVIQKPAEFK